MTAPDLTEARRIVGELAELRESLSLPDRKFLYGWRVYLKRRGDTALIGPWRLAMLRKIAALNGVQCEAWSIPEVDRVEEIVRS